MAAGAKASEFCIQMSFFCCQHFDSIVLGDNRVKNFINVRITCASEIWTQLTKIFSKNQVQKDLERTFY